MISRKERFILSKCDRCGKSTPANQNGIGDLFTLPHEWRQGLSDVGDFCQRCIGRYDEEDWAAWIQKRDAAVETPTE